MRKAKNGNKKEYYLVFLSIIIPIHNTPECYLRQCLDSCLEQDISTKEYEIICINNGSTTDVLSVLNEYEKRNDNVIVISQENRYLSGARNTGIRNAKGDYLWFVDSDDFIRKNCLYELKKETYSNKVDRLCLGAYHFINSDPNIQSLQPNHKLRSIFATRSLYCKEFLDTNNLMFREEVRILGEDMLFNFEIDQFQHKEGMIDKVFYYYRIHDNSFSHADQKQEFYITFITNHLNACSIVKTYYNKKVTFDAIRYLHVDIAQIMVYISKISYTDGRRFLSEIIDRKIIPYVKLFSKKPIIVFYTNIHSLNLQLICKCSRHRVFHWILKAWAKIWGSKTKRRLEKFVKRKIAKE